MQLVTIQLKSGNSYLAHPENVKVYPGGDIEFKKARYADFRQRIYSRLHSGMVSKSELKQIIMH